MVIGQYSVLSVYRNVWFEIALRTPQGSEKLSETLPQSLKSDKDRDQKFQEQLRDAPMRKLTQLETKLLVRKESRREYFAR